MAQLKDTVIQGSLRVTDTTITTDLMVTATKTARYAFIAPTSNGAPTWRALTKADISDFPTSMTPASHTHGNITNDGKIGSAGKKYFVIVGTDNKITTLSTTEIGSGTTKFLREDGSWQTPAYIANAAYGNISTSGTITSTGVALANGDYLLFSDASNNGKIERTSITIGTATNTWLRNDGTWNTPTKGNVGLGNVENVAGNARVFYGTSNTAAGTAAKVVTCSSYDALTAGDMIVVKFDNANTVASPTLNVNSKGAKNIKKLYNGAINNLTANGEITGTCLFLYDGTQWLLTNADYNNTYSSQAAASGGTTLSLVTTGEKYTWNSKTANTGTVTTVATGSGLTGGPITTSGTISVATGGVTNAMLAGSIDNSKLLNSTISIGGNSVALGGSISLADLGLDSAMHYRGTVTAIPPASGTYSSGDVVVLNNTLKEYVYDGTDWRELGSEGSYKVKQTAYSDSTGTSENTTATRFVYSISQTADGAVSFKTRPLPTYNNYSLPIAAYNTLGGLKPPYSNTKAATITTTAASVSNDITIAARSTTTGRYYAIEVDKNGVPFVNVPWTNVNSSYLTGVTTTVSGSGNGVTGVTASGDTITVTKGTFLTSHQTYTSFTGKPTGNQTPGFGSTFTIQQISQSTAGQVSGTDRTVTIPSTIAKNDTVGLVKPWYNHTSASTGPTAGSNATAVAVNTITTTSGRYYAIEADSNGRLFVNVPWINVSAMTGATANVAGTGGTVPAPAAGDQNSFLCGDGTWSSYSPTVLTLTLTASSWTSEKTQAITANGVTTTNTVIVGPTPSSITDYTNANIVCTTQGVDVLVFSTTRTPTTDITINVVIFDTDDNLTVSQNALTGALTIS